MPFIAAVAKIELPFKVTQADVKEQARSLFAENFPQVDRLIHAFDNTEIVTRNFCKPIGYYTESNTFEERNNEYISISLEYSIQASEDCMKATFCKRPVR